MANLYTRYAKEPGRVSQKDKRIDSYIERQNQGEMDALLAGETDFQVFYNLSELRTGIISWYDFKEDARVLEIGAGFGAVTGYLCRRCAYVAATERSLYRAQAIAKRYASVDHLDVYAGDVMDMEFSKPFDIILLIGILERAGRGSSDTGPYVAYLEGLKRFLKPEGKFLLAVENRLGLRYFCGAPEPHTKHAFDGLNRYRFGTSGVSFTRREIEEIARAAGMPCMKFYYPLPDYRFPQLIYTDRHLPEKNLRERLIPYYRRNDTLVASEMELYDDVAENGVFPFFSNSFLLECGREENLGQVAYAALSTDRGRERSYATAIWEDGKVKKRPLFPEGRKNADALCRNLQELEERGIPVAPYRRLEDGSLEMPFVESPTLSNYIKEIIKKDPKELEALVERLYRFILQSSDPGEYNALLERIKEDGGRRQKGRDKEAGGGKLPESLDFGPILKKAFIELIPLNCFYCPKKKEFLFFDQEFVRENYPAKYVLFRAIHYIYSFTPDAERSYPKQKFKEKYGMEDTWDIYFEEEKRFLDEVRNHRRYGQFYRWTKVDWGRIQANSRKLESQEEEIAGYRISDKMKQVWKIELGMLDEVDRICRKYGLSYFLIHGSLLGAVRHRGFIPWDDDMDIAMPRADYDRFLELAQGELAQTLSLCTPCSEPDLFWGGGARIRDSRTTGIEQKDFWHKGCLGIWIDVLPLDVCTADEKKFEKKQKKIRHFQRLLYAKIYGKEYRAFRDMKGLKWKAYCILARFYAHSALCRHLDGAMRLYTQEESEDVAFFSGYDMHRRLHRADFEQASYLEFEGRQAPVPIGYKNYLFMLMGKDYLKYPPKEKRKPKHRGIFDPFQSYGAYQSRFGNLLEGVEGKKLILFGSGMMFEDYMKKYGKKRRPDFLVDNDENKWGRARMGIEVRSPRELLPIPPKERKLVICSFYYKEIEKQLEEMGISDYSIYVQKVEWILEAEEAD